MRRRLFVEKLEDRLLLSAVPAPYLPDAPMISSGSQQIVSQSVTVGNDPVITFDGAPDQTSVGDLYANQGVQFSNATILTTNISLNPVFPPYSGLTVVYNFPGSKIEADAVGSLWNSVGGYITGNEPIEMVAYASNGSVLGMTGTTGANYIGAGAPNRFLTLTANGIASVQFIGSTDNTFTLDDFTYATSQPIFPTSINWAQYDVPGYEDGVTTYTYDVDDTLTQDVPIALYWSPTAKFDSTTATLVAGTQTTVPAGTTAGSYTGYVDDDDLVGSPAGTQYLLEVVGDPTSANFSVNQATMSAQLSIDVPYVSQAGAGWASNFLDGKTGHKLQTFGCAVTALDMALNNAGLSPSLNPGQLNTELTGTDGFTPQANLDWANATDIAASNGGVSGLLDGNANLNFNNDYMGATSTQALRDAFTSTGEPVIVKVTNYSRHPNGGTHFVLVTGLTSDSFTINDPGFAARTTLNSSYNNSTAVVPGTNPVKYTTGPSHDYQDDGFSIVGDVQDPPASGTQLNISLESSNPNLNLALVDPQGRVTGLTAGGSSSLQQIPGSHYFVEGPLEDLDGLDDGTDTDQFVYISNPAGSYSLETSGIGDYTITMSGVAPNGQLIPPTVLTGTSTSATPMFTPIQFLGDAVSDFVPGITAIGGSLYLIGDTTADDQIQISPIGASNTGSTGVQINGTLNGVSISNTYALTSPSIYFSGTNGNDSVQLASTLALDTYVSSGGGNDQVVAGGGSTTVVLGSGNDNVQLGNGNDSVALGDGNNNVQLGNGTDSANLGNGSNTLQLGAGNNTVIMGNGNDDVFSVGNGNESITLGDGRDILKLGSGTDNVQLGNGNDIVFALGNGKDSVTLGNGYNYIILGDGNDSIMAGDGNNNVQLGNGNDMVVMGLGNDNVRGGDGSDSITLGNGSDNVQLGNGTDTLLLGDGNDIVQCGKGTDQITLGNGDDYLTLGNGDNVAVLGNGDDNVQLGNGNNTVVLGNGHDTVAAGTGANIIKRGNGYDD